MIRKSGGGRGVGFGPVPPWSAITRDWPNEGVYITLGALVCPRAYAAEFNGNRNRYIRDRSPVARVNPGAEVIALRPSPWRSIAVQQGDASALGEANVLG